MSNGARKRSRALAAAVAFGFAPNLVRAQVAGAIGIHDPSAVIEDGSTYFLYGTGQGIAAKWSPDRINWHDEPSGVFAAPPAWTTQAVPGFTGFFWAPDIAYFNGKYHLYYSASSWGTIDSAIGVATSPTLNRTAANYGFTDQGKVVQSDAAWDAGPNTDTTAYNAIDPSIFVDNSTNRVWMAFGSYSSGILVTEINPATGKRLNTGALSATRVANNAPGGGWGSTIEGAALTQRGSHYYLFVNYGGCCAGVNSTYEIRVGRSTSPTGPFLDKNGIDMSSAGGSVFLEDNGKYVGPGHLARFTETDGTDYYSYHYYNADSNGAPTFNQQRLYWTADGWPSPFAVSPDWGGAINSNWSQALNWSGNTVPHGAGHVANFGAAASTRNTIVVDGGGRTVGTLNFFGSGGYTVGEAAGSVITLDAAAAGESATLNAQAGTHTIAAPINAVDALGVNVTGGARLNLAGTVTGKGMTKYGHGTLAVNGTAAFTEALLLKWGNVEVNGAITANAFTSIGHRAFESSTMIVRGSGSFTANGDLNVGDAGNAADPATGSLHINDAASVTIAPAGGFYVGSGFFANTRANGTVIQTGGTLTANGSFDGTFIIGGRTSTLASGTYNLSGGTVNANTNVQVAGRGTGNVNQTGGAFNSNAFVAIGRYGGAAGNWNITGGALSLTNAARMLIVGEAGAGTLTVSGVGEVSTAGPLRLGHATGGAGVVHLDGGVITAPSTSRGSGTATFNFNGGTLRASAGSAAFLQGLTRANIGAGGAIIDTQSFNVTIAQPLLHGESLGNTLDGGLRKLGAGTLALAGSNTYTGGTTVNAGMLRLEKNLTTSTSVNVAGGALLVAGGANSNRVLKTPAVLISANGRIDLQDNKLLTDTPVGTWDGTKYTGIQGEVSRAYNFGAWDLPGIMTSMPDAGATVGKATIGVATGKQALFLAPTATGLFAGQTISGATAIAMYTWAGDVDLNGYVDAVDYGTIDQWIQFPGTTGYTNGDLNYDGVIDAVDYGIIDNGIQLQGAPIPINAASSEPAAAAGAAHLTAVPEPTAASIILLAGATLLSRRRNRRAR